MSVTSAEEVLTVNPEAAGGTSAASALSQDGQARLLPGYSPLALGGQHGCPFYK